MREKAKNITKGAVNHGVLAIKRTVNKSPRIKRSIKNALSLHLSSGRGNVDKYEQWVKNNFSDSIEELRMKSTCDKFSYKPLISIIVPTYNTDIGFLRDCIDSVLVQVYDEWELCIVDDASSNSEVRTVIEEYAKKDTRIKYKFLKNNHHIAGATNEAIKLASGDFIGLFDHDDILWPNALYEVARALNDDKTIDFLYSDEDKITEDRHQHLGPFFKPDWNPDFLHSVNYITHFSVIRKTLLDKVGGLNGDYNGAQDWDLFLRVSGATKNIFHIPKIIYSWRIHSESTAMSTDSKPYVVEAQRLALRDDLIRKGYKDAKVEQDDKNPGYWKVVYPVKNNPLVSIVIPSKNQYKVLKRCIDSIYQKTSYSNFEIILVDTGSDDQKLLRWYKEVQNKHSNFKLVNWHETPFSYARSCNEGARNASGDILIMLNNDTEVMTPNWLELMTGEAQRSEIGAVGALLFYPDKIHIQHAGVGVGLGGVAANSLQMMTLSQPMNQTQHLYANVRHNMTAVTAACMAIRKTVFDEVGGFDEGFRITYNDVDLCLKLREAGYENLYTPYVQLVHHESISLGTPDQVSRRDTREFESAVKQFKSKWQKYIDHDPNINSNINKENAFYDI